MRDTSETNTKVLYRELFFGVVALKTPIPQNHYLRDKVPFLKSGHIYVTRSRKRGHFAQELEIELLVLKGRVELKQ